MCAETISCSPYLQQQDGMNPMPRVIVLDNIAQEGLDLLDAAADITYEVRTGLKGDELREALAEYDGAVCRSGVKITAEALDGNRRLKAIVRAGVGTDNIDKPAATRHGIVVMNTPTGNTLSTAEHTFALMLGLSRQIAPRIRACKKVDGIASRTWGPNWRTKRWVSSDLAESARKLPVVPEPLKCGLWVSIRSSPPNRQQN